MQKLVAGTMEMDIVTAIGSYDVLNGSAVDSVRLLLPNDISEEQIKALLENPWSIYAEDGSFLKTHAGYNHVKEYSITFLKVPDEAKMMAELIKAADEITESKKLAEEKAQQVEALQQDVAMLNNRIRDMIGMMAEAGISKEA